MQEEGSDVHENTQAVPKDLHSSKKLKRIIEKAEKRGIVYKPQKLRHLLEQYGEVGRVYLAPEDPLVRKKRKKMGGNSGRNFTEGWIEFEDKKDAKMVAQLLNGQPMGGKKRSSHYYDLWCIKYLPKFKWDHLTEELNYQRAVQDQKMAAEVAAAKRDRDFYLSRVDRAKAVESIIERNKRKEPKDDGSEAAGKESNGPRVKRQFTQKKVKPDPTKANETSLGPSQSLLEKLAGNKKKKS
eukprot:jgi/Picsp_1/975/NSC_04459-R1_protein